MAVSEKTMLERIAGSVALTAVNRVGLPLMAAFVVWEARELVDLERRVAVVESRAESHARQVSTASDVIARMDGRQAATEATMTQVLRSLTRIETVLDQRR